MKTNRQTALLCVLLAALLLAGCKELFHPEGPAEPYPGGGSYPDGGSYHDSSTSVPSVPYNVTAQAISSSSITVNWGSVYGASGYYVYRASGSNGSYSLITIESSITYTDTGLSSNTTYYYKVSAYNSYGESAMSSYDSATTTSGTPSGTPNPNAPDSGTLLTSGQTTEGSISTTTPQQYYYFSATEGRTYTVFWYDADNYSGYADIKVSAYWHSDGTSIFSLVDNGSSGRSINATRTGYVMLEVTPYGSSRGRYQILYR
jgi:hypothetical protein